MFCKYLIKIILERCRMRQIGNSCEFFVSFCVFVLPALPALSATRFEFLNSTSNLERDKLDFEI